MLEVFIFVLVVAGITWLYQKSRQSTATTYFIEGSEPVQSQHDESHIRLKIANEIRSQAGQYISIAQKQVVEEMAQTVEYFAAHAYEEISKEDTSKAQEASYHESGAISQIATQAQTVMPNVTMAETVPYETPWKKLQFLDGAVILLYLGAFFVLSSIGLYIGFGSGATIKAVLASLIAAVFYLGGIALYKRSTRLKPAGQTFVAIGMATIPMAGAALYYYSLARTHGALVWFLTSIITLGVYAHALRVLRSPLVSYMIVFSSISLVLSGVSSVGLAPFYFIQGLGFAGLLFVVLSRYLGAKDTGIADAYEQSASFMVPFSMGLGVLFVTQTGLIQLSSSLLLGAGYYAYAAVSSQKYRSTYAALAQSSFVAALLCGTYGITNSVLALAGVSMFVSTVYSAVWLGWASKLDSSNVYRQQVQAFLYTLPLLAGVILLGHPHLLWTATGLFFVQSLMMYVNGRDLVSGVSWVFSLLALPALVGLLAFSSPIELQLLGFWYLALLICSVVPGLVASEKFTTTDSTLQQILLFSSLLISGCLEVGAGNGHQVVMMGSQLAVLTLHALRARDRDQWFVVATIVQLIWLVCFVDSPTLLFAAVSGVGLYNLAVSYVKGANILHAWVASSAILILPAIYGTMVSTELWHAEQYGVAYAALFALFFALRVTNTVFSKAVSYTAYILAFSTAVIFGYTVNAGVALVVSVLSASLLLLFERVESEQSWGYIAPLMPLGVFVVSGATYWQMLWALMFSTVGSIVLIGVRKRSYEAIVAMIGILALPWFASVYLYSWPVSTLCYIYTALAALLIAVRLLINSQSLRQQFHAIVITGYVVALCIGLGYALGGSWMLLSFSLFMSGLLLVAVSYIEKAPWVIILAFGCAYGFLLRYTTGLRLPMSATVGLFVGVSQAVYWLLIVSKLDTVRAKYAQYTQLAVALMIPIVGLFGYGMHVIFPVSLLCFGVMLSYEVRRGSQINREVAISVIHIAILWWLYILGVREVQVYTQSTAVLIGCFALWRRYLLETPGVINAYLWTAVLTFSLPMVYQALTSGNLVYAYLVLIEHVVLTIISIGFKRATFAWWGIGVVVVSMLYQLRQLRYAALAFLGVFIIAMAVYFLLKYNQPPAKK